MAHKFEINRDLVSIFKKVTKKWEIVAVEIRKKLSIAVNYTVFTFFSLFSRLNAIAMEKKKKKRDTRLSLGMNFLSFYNFNVSRVSVSENTGERDCNYSTILS